MASSYDKKEFTPVIKICEYCGKQYVVDTYIKFKARKYCSDHCRDMVKYEKDKERRLKNKIPTRFRQDKEREKAIDSVLGPVLSPEKVMENFHKPKKKKGEVKDYLAEDAVAARQAGMSYGEYTSQRYAPRLFKNS